MQIVFLLTIVLRFPRATEYVNQFGNKATNPVEKYERTLAMPPAPLNQDELR